MILQDLKRAAAAAAGTWAKSQGLAEPADLAFNPAPPHVRADLSMAWPLQAGKLLKRKPLDVASDLAKALTGLPGVEPPAAAPPGFVNFTLKKEALAGNLAGIVADPAAYGANPHAARRSVLFEFVSANPTGPLHLASGRAATLGDSLVRIFRRIGHKTWAEYYVNDAGRQVELLGQSVKARWEQAKGKDSPLPEGGYQGEYIAEVASKAPPRASSWGAPDFSRFAIETLLETHREDMKAFGVSFDRWFLESELHKSGAVEKALHFLKDRGMAYENEGAVWLGTSSQGEEDDKDRVLVRSDGRPTYFLGDIAYHKDKFDRGWEELIDIWGADHHGYVPRMKAAVAALGKDPESFHAIIHQLVHLYRGKELVKMSKRAGEFVTLKDLIAEAGRDACRFFFAQRTPNAHMNFDLDLAKKQSQENPVYYVQYVHARVCSIFREAAKARLAPICSRDMEGQCASLDKPQERALLVKLAWFPDVLGACERELSPHPLPNYLLELAGLFHPFYEECRVVDPAKKDLSQARLALCAGVRSVIAEGLGLLGVSAPESM